MRNIHIIATDKPSRLFKYNNGLGFSKGFQNGSNAFLNQNIYITNSEEIKEERCWVINTMNKIESVPHSKWGNLIILTTDQDLIADGIQPIDNEFLEWFVKNPSCESIEIDKGYRGVDLFNYKIIIPKEEPKQQCEHIKEYGCIKDICTCNKGKQEKIEEVAERLYPRDNSIHDFTVTRHKRNAFKNGYNYAQQQNKNLYSEDETGELVYNIIGEYAKRYNIIIDGEKLNDLFEQFKKKQ